MFFCAFKGFYCFYLHLGAKDLFMHKKHSLHALNIKITIEGRVYPMKISEFVFGLHYLMFEMK
jgi:hypothetical protein